MKIKVDDTKKCYVTLGLIPDKYHSINDKFKDYRCNPKTNLYRSLHSTVFGPNEKVYLPNLTGEVLEIPNGSNIVDLACYIDLENILIGAKIND